MTDPDSAPRARPSIRKGVIIAPFGRYITGNPVPPPNNATLLGRRPQRAKLLDLLRNHGAPSAYLITGYRGAGKTSFVRDVLAHYQKDVFPRFLKSGIGRHMLWDRTTILIAGFFAIIGLVSLGEIFNALITRHLHKYETPFALIILVPVGLACLLPILYSYRLLSSIVGVSIPAGHNTDRLYARIIPPLTLILIAVLTHEQFPFAQFLFPSPIHAISRLILLLSMASLCISVAFAQGFKKHLRFISTTTAILFALYCIIAAIHDFSDPIIDLAFVFYCGSIGSIFIFADNKKRNKLETTRPHKDTYKHRKNIAQIFSLIFYASWLLLIWPHCATTSLLYLLLLATLPLALFLATSHSLWPIGPPQDDTHLTDFSLSSARTLLTIKALFFAIIGFQVSSPALGPSQIGFHNLDAPQKAAWCAFALFMLSLQFHLEYAWILKRSFCYERTDLASQEPNVEIFNETRQEQRYWKTVQNTIPWQTYYLWLPTIIVPTSLGIEGLTRRNVIHAMLTGLRGQYYARFLRWNSPLGTLFRAARIGATLIITSLLSSLLFSSQAVDLKDHSNHLATRAPINDHTCARIDMSEKSHLSIEALVCHYHPQTGSIFIRLLHFDLLSAGVEQYTINNSPRSHLWCHLFRCEDISGSPRPTPQERRMIPTLPLYYVLLFTSLFIMARFISKRFPLFPHRTNLRRIDRLLDRLSAKTRNATSQNSRVSILNIARSMDHSWSREMEPADPRIVEHAFMQILDDLQRGPLGGTRHEQRVFLSIPTPEIIFVFDELDKFGLVHRQRHKTTATGLSDESHSQSGVDIKSREYGEASARISQLNSLFADMKNLMTSSAARFIFIGGRELHDEWLVDKTKRTPLLTNVFNAEVYLPSFLVDSHPSAAPTWWFRTHQYLRVQSIRSKRLYEITSRERRQANPALGGLHNKETESLRDSAHQDSEYRFSELLVYDSNGNLTSTPPDFGDRFADDFARFLTYRSVGNPKRLKELLEAFIAPTGATTPGITSEKCDHILIFDQHDQFRIQFLADAYRFLTLCFEERFSGRDDKAVAALFFIVDFLFKFHSRAFAWSNLERLEELAQIHKSPDLWSSIEDLVRLWSEPFLHQILNGLYSFRFRSDIAKEIAYISRQSPQEMSSFNFTLDEAQALKAQYRGKVDFMGSSAPSDLVASLGELHDFDQELDLARYYYRKAIRSLDDDFNGIFGNDIEKSDVRRTPAFAAARAIRAWDTGRADSRQSLTWGADRLRLMLQVGMTYERTSNLETAALEYRNAQTLARALILALLGRSDFGARPTLEKEAERVHSLKHMNILFQPAFADAWVAEKMPGAIDTSGALIENWLFLCRNTLPFVSLPDPIPPTKDPSGTMDSNFSVTLAELHNKAGDLLFFKGVDVDRVRDGADSRSEKPGYLLRAHYHYSMGLHDLRRFISHRRRSSAYKLYVGPLEENNEEACTISKGEPWPEFIHRALGSSIADMAESMFARMSLRSLLDSVYGLEHQLNEHDWRTHSQMFRTEAEQWMDRSAVDDRLWTLPVEFFGKSLADWLGIPAQTWSRFTWPKDELWLKFGPANEDIQRFVVTLHLTTLGAKYLARAGYLEDSARELTQVAETVAQFFWWGDSLIRINHPKASTQTAPQAGFWKYLMEAAISSLERASTNFERHHRHTEEGRYLIGGVIPTRTLVVACSLILASEHCGLLKGLEGLEALTPQAARLAKIICKWIGRDEKKGQPTELASEQLENVFQNHPFPMASRLFALKVLIDNLSARAKSEVDRALLAQRAHELIALSDDYNSPLHFTPFDSGITLGLAYLSIMPPAQPKLTSISGADELLMTALRHLNQSEEMISMRRGYYEAISSLYYLHDDFNDRRLHFCHSVQMAGRDLTAALKTKLDAVRSRSREGVRARRCR